jgi:hypothetical protein
MDILIKGLVIQPFFLLAAGKGTIFRLLLSCNLLAAGSSNVQQRIGKGGLNYEGKTII